MSTAARGAASVLALGLLTGGCAAHAAASLPRVGPGRAGVVTLPAADAPDGRRPVWVYRPGVADSRRLPVLYFLTGEGGTEEDLPDRLHLQRWLDAAFTSGRLRPFVVVSPSARSTGAEDPEWGDSADGRVREETFVTRTLVDAVEGSARRDRRHRAVVGISMGGFGAANLAQRHPGLYGQLAEVGGYFHLDDPDGVFGADPAGRDANRPDRNVSRLRNTRVMLVDGGADRQPPSAGELDRFARLLHADGQHPAVLTVPGYPHGWTTLAAVWPRLVAFLEQEWGS